MYVVPQIAGESYASQTERARRRVADVGQLVFKKFRSPAYEEAKQAPILLR